MTWYEYQPFYWILKNLTARQITSLILAGFLVCLFIGSYYVYLDTVRSLQDNPFYLSIYKWAAIFVIILLALFFLLSFDLRFKLGLEGS